MNISSFIHNFFSLTASPSPSVSSQPYTEPPYNPIQPDTNFILIYLSIAIIIVGLTIGAYFFLKKKTSLPDYKNTKEDNK